jgi:ribonuclease P protein component
MLKKENRVHKKKEFDQFFGVNFKKKRGINASSQNLILKILFSNDKKSKFGFIVSNQVDKRATARNLLKRRLREIVRLNLDKFKLPVDAIILAKVGSKKLEYAILEKELVSLFKKVRGYDS